MTCPQFSVSLSPLFSFSSPEAAPKPSAKSIYGKFIATGTPSQEKLGLREEELRTWESWVRGGGAGGGEPGFQGLREEGLRAGRRRYGPGLLVLRKEGCGAGSLDSWVRRSRSLGAWTPRSEGGEARGGDSCVRRRRGGPGPLGLRGEGLRAGTPESEGGGEGPGTLGRRERQPRSPDPSSSSPQSRGSGTPPW